MDSELKSELSREFVQILRVLEMGEGYLEGDEDEDTDIQNSIEHLRLLFSSSISAISSFLDLLGEKEKPQWVVRGWRAVSFSSEPLNALIDP